MCVIIHKPAGIVIPEQKIESAWQNNKDGFGVTFVDRGQFQIRKWLSKDPDEINKFLTEIKDCDAMLHLRFKTKGAVSRDNLHPFTVLTKKRDGVDLQFCHNGTLYEFGDSDQSDTAQFNAEVVRPMFAMLAKKYDNSLSDMLDDPFGQMIMEKYRGSSSVFMLHGEKGESIRFGKGVDFDGWWASNNSYFNNYTRVKKEETSSGQSVVPFTPSHTVAKNDTTVSGTTGTTNGIRYKKLPDRVESDDIFSLIDISDPSDLCYYTHEAFEQMVMDYPYEAACLMRYLVQEMFWDQYENKKETVNVNHQAL